MFGYLDRSFFPIGSLPDLITTYSGDYQLGLVVLSILIAILASYAALDLSGRVVASSTRAGRLSWIAAGAAVMGLGIWAMHFVGMLAFSLPCGIAYDPEMTLLSIVPAVLASSVALYLVSRKRTVSLRSLALGSLLMGGGIGAMHYTGMSAIRLPAILTYSTVMVANSVLVAILLSFLALSMRCVPYLRALLGRYSILASATVMGVAVSGMHYTAMDAAVFFPLGDQPSVLNAVDPNILAILIALFAVFIVAIALTAGFAGRQSETAYRLQTEIGSRRKIEREALRGRARLQAVFDSVADAIVSAGADGRIQHWSSAAERIFGYTEVEVSDLRLADLMLGFPDIQACLDSGEALAVSTGHETIGLRRDRSQFPLEVSLSQAQVEDDILLTGVMRDITERKHHEETRHLAHHDALTGLPNRLSLLGRLEQTLAYSRRNSERFALMFIDLDRFKIINDTMGHQVGDDLLREVAARLKASIHRETDFAARLGGDEFILVLTGNPSPGFVAYQAETTRKAVGAPYSIDGHKPDTTPSIGIALFPEDGDMVEILMKNADSAMYQAKRGGRNNVRFFDRKSQQPDEAAAPTVSLEVAAPPE